MKHLIHRQILDLHFADIAQANEKQQQVSRLWQDRLLPIADAVFSELTASGETIRLDSLVIDLGTLDWADTDKWVENWREQLTIALKSALSQNTVLPNLPHRFSEMEGLIFFLKTGQAAWWIVDKSTYEPVEIVEKLIAEQPGALKKALKAFFIGIHSENTEGGVLERLIQQFSAKTLDKLSYLLEPNSTKAPFIIDFFERIITEINLATPSVFSEGILIKKGFLKEISLEKSLKTRLIELKRQAIFLKKEKDFLLFLTDIILNTFFKETTYSLFQQKIQAVLKADTIQNLPNEALIFFKKAIKTLEKIDKKQDFIEDKNKETAAEKALKSSENQPVNTDKLQKKVVENEQKTNTEPVIVEKETNAFFIDNAGLILIAPFFKLFFKNLELLDNKTFINKAAQQKAILITQYLVTEATQSYEHELVFNKILCGYPILETLPKDLLITDKEKAECLELLKTVMTHWKVMKNTSLPTFRESFLKRKGKLEQKENNAWSLMVERQTIDILFDASPIEWTFSFVKLPWMAQPILTEW